MHTSDIWWKSALTLGQMIQFVLMNLQAGYLLYNDCKLFPKNIIVAYLLYILSLLVLFANFFVMSYVFKKGDKKSKDKKTK
jgi:elongation of very long chain fatty acids protein 4